MKKTIVLLLALCLLLCACGGPATAPTEATTPETEPPALVLYNEKEGRNYLNLRRFNEILETVELTPENWLDHVEVYAYTEETYEKNAFGEYELKNSRTVWTLGAKDDQFYHFKDFAVELKHKESGETLILGASGVGVPEREEELFLDQYECVRVQGTLYLVDIPAEVIACNERNIRFFDVGTTEPGEERLYTCSLLGLDGRWVGGMFDFFVY